MDVLELHLGEENTITATEVLDIKYVRLGRLQAVKKPDLKCSKR